MQATKKPKKVGKSQKEKFVEAAREIGNEENEEAGDELMKRVASSPAPPKKRKTKTEEALQVSVVEIFETDGVLIKRRLLLIQV